MSKSNFETNYIVGKPYFKFSYHDTANYRNKESIYPCIETIIYLGDGIDLIEVHKKQSFEPGFLYFQDAESYALHGLLNSLGHIIRVVSRAKHL